MEPTFLVIHRQTCPDCKGRRVVHDPTGFFEKLRRADAEAPGGRMDEVTYLRFVCDHGYDTDNPAGWPAAEEQCQRCKGSGAVNTLTTLAKAIECLAAKNRIKIGLQPRTGHNAGDPLAGIIHSPDC